MLLFSYAVWEAWKARLSRGHEVKISKEPVSNSSKGGVGRHLGRGTKILHARREGDEKQRAS